MSFVGSCSQLARSRPCTRIRRRDVIALVDDITRRNGAQMADKALAVLGKFYAWLIARDVVDASPCRGVQRPVRNPPRDRVLSEGSLLHSGTPRRERRCRQAVRLLC